MSALPKAKVKKVVVTKAPKIKSSVFHIFISLTNAAKKNSSDDEYQLLERKLNAICDYLWTDRGLDKYVQNNGDVDSIDITIGELEHGTYKNPHIHCVVSIVHHSSVKLDYHGLQTLIKSFFGESNAYMKCRVGKNSVIAIESYIAK